MRTFIALLSLFISPSLSWACGWFFTEAEIKYNLLNPEVINQPDFKPYFLSENLYYGWWPSMPDGTEENLFSWESHFKWEFDTADIYEVLYPSTLEDLENMRDGKTILLPSYRGNELVKAFLDDEWTETLDYFIYAKKCEPHALIGNGAPTTYWGEPEEIDEEAMKELSREGVKGFLEADGEFLKLRYAFQAIRMAHYAGEYQMAVNHYDAMIEKYLLYEACDYCMISDWALSLKAGALYKMGRNVESSFHFAQLFDRCPTRRSSAYLTFSINNDQEWEECLAMAEYQDQEANLWFLLGIDYFNLSLTPMRKVIELNGWGNDDNAEVLLVRNLAKAELQLMPGRIEAWSGGDLEPNWDFIDGLTEIIEKQVNEGLTTHPALWTFASGYMHFLIGDYKMARTRLQESLDKPGSDDFPKLENQAQLLATVIDVSEMNKPDLNKLNEMVPYLDALEEETDDHASDGFDYIMEEIARIYYSNNGQSHNAESILCLAQKFEYSDFKYTAHFLPLDDLIAFLQKPNKSAFEQFLTDRCPHSLEDLYEMKGTVHLYHGELEEALEAFKELDDDYETYGYQRYRLDDNPFAFYDPGYSEIDNKGDRSFTKKQLVEKLIELENLAKTDKVNRYDHLMELGIAWYNFTYWGNSWDAVTYWRSSTGIYLPGDEDRVENLDQRMFKNSPYMLGSLQNLNYSKPQKYFNSAIEAARNKEEKARAIWLSSLCDQRIKGWNNSYSDADPGEESYFEELHANYSGTSFYEEVILDCAIFRNYWGMPPLERYR